MKKKPTKLSKAEKKKLKGGATKNTPTGGFDRAFGGNESKDPGSKPTSRNG